MCCMQWEYSCFKNEAQTLHPSSCWANASGPAAAEDLCVLTSVSPWKATGCMGSIQTGRKAAQDVGKGCLNWVREEKQRGSSVIPWVMQDLSVALARVFCSLLKSLAFFETVNLTDSASPQRCLYALGFSCLPFPSFLWPEAENRADAVKHFHPSEHLWAGSKHAAATCGSAPPPWIMQLSPSKRSLPHKKRLLGRYSPGFRFPGASVQYLPSDLNSL